MNTFFREAGQIALLILAILAVVVSMQKCSEAATLYPYEVVRVIDGDTVEVKAPFLPSPLKPVLSVRVNSVDTPEKAPRAACQKEADLAVQASAFTRKALKDAKQVQIEIKGWDKYGGRVLGDVYYDGKWLSEQLISNGFAVPYFGAKKQGWCP